MNTQSKHTPSNLIFCEIRDIYGDVESCSSKETTAECIAYFKDRGIDFKEVAGKDCFTYTRLK